MNLKDMLEKISQLSEATKKTDKGIEHKADPGGYGRKYDTDEEGDEKKKEKKPEVKKGRGRPKKDADETGEKKTYDTKSLHGVFGGGQKPKKEIGKTSKKHSLKEYFDQIDQALLEAEQITIAPAQQSAHVIKQGDKTLGTVTNPQLAQQIKQSIGKGEMSLAGSKIGESEMDESTGNYSAKAARAGKDIGKPGKAFAKIAKSAGEKYGSKEKGEKVAGSVLAKLRAKTNEADQPPNDALASPLTMEAKKAKPDFLDIDKDGNKKESMKKAATDKKKVDESMDNRLKSAHHRGKAHALAKESYNCKYDDMEEARMYHQGYKEGLDECYGMMPISGLMVGETDQTTVDDMASYGAHTPSIDEMTKGEYMKHKAQTTPGDTFKAFGQTFKDKEVLESPFAFESWDNQLQSLLEDKEEVQEGLSVSISKGQQGSPDSVSVTANDGEADQLLSFIKQAGLGLFGGDDKPQGIGAMVVDKGDEPAEIGTGGEDIQVVGDHDGMMDLIKKVTGAGQSDDYEEEGGHDHDEETCEKCGESDCGCDESVEETETVDQAEEEVAEADDGTQEEFASMDQEIAADNAAASSHGGADNSNLEEESDEEEEEVDESMQFNEWANDMGRSAPKEETFVTDADFMINDITSGLNKRKSTGQTTVPVIAGQTDRMKSHTTNDLTEWKKLAGLK